MITNEKLLLAHRKNRLEDARCILHTKMLEKQKMHATFCIEKERRNAAWELSKMKKYTSGYSTEGVPSSGPEDRFYIKSPFFPGGLLHDGRFRHWKNKDKQLNKEFSSLKKPKSRVGCHSAPPVLSRHKTDKHGQENVMHALRNILLMVGFTRDEIQKLVGVDGEEPAEKEVSCRNKSSSSSDVPIKKRSILRCNTAPTIRIRHVQNENRTESNAPASVCDTDSDVSDDNSSSSDESVFEKPVTRLRSTPAPTRKKATILAPDATQLFVPTTVAETEERTSGQSDNESESSDIRPLITIAETQPRMRKVSQLVAQVKDQKGRRRSIAVPETLNSQETALELLRRLSTVTGDRRLSMFQPVREEPAKQTDAHEGQKNGGGRKSFIRRQTSAIERKISEMRQLQAEHMEDSDEEVDEDKQKNDNNNDIKNEIKSFIDTLPRWKRDLLRESPTALTNQEPLKMKLALSSAKRRRDLEKLMQNKVGDIRGIVSKERARKLQSRLSVFLSLYAAENGGDSNVEKWQV